jgi:ADP-ribosylglycohydrolase
MLGAIAGDIIGSSYDFHSTKRTDFDLFTHSRLSFY